MTQKLHAYWMMCHSCEERTQAKHEQWNGGGVTSSFLRRLRKSCIFCYQKSAMTTPMSNWFSSEMIHLPIISRKSGTIWISISQTGGLVVLVPFKGIRSHRTWCQRVLSLEFCERSSLSATITKERGWNEGKNQCYCDTRHTAQNVGATISVGCLPNNLNVHIKICSPW